MHSSFGVFVKFVEGCGKFEFKLQILDPKGAPVFEGRRLLEIAEDLSFAGAELALSFQGFPFKMPGIYRLRVLLDDVQLGNDRSLRLRKTGEG